MKEVCGDQILYVYINNNEIFFQLYLDFLFFIHTNQDFFFVLMPLTKHYPNLLRCWLTTIVAPDN